jgi:hypothetical protein
MIFVAGYIGGLILAPALGIRCKSHLGEIVLGIVAGSIAVVVCLLMLR